jgi:hypothetical protein
MPIAKASTAPEVSIIFLLNARVSGSGGRIKEVVFRVMRARCMMRDVRCVWPGAFAVPTPSYLDIVVSHHHALVHDGRTERTDSSVKCPLICYGRA